MIQHQESSWFVPDRMGEILIALFDADLLEFIQSVLDELDDAEPVLHESRLSERRFSTRAVLCRSDLEHDSEVLMNQQMEIK
jgi:hypothetical protein